MKRAGKILRVLAVVPLFASCAATGPTVTRYEIELKRTELESKAAQYRTSQLRRVEAISKRLITFMTAEDRARLRNLRYKLSDDADINASMSMTTMTVTYGMLRFAESDDELAAIIGHELAHNVKGHIVKGMGTRMVGAALGIAAGAAIGGLTDSGSLGNAITETVSQGVGGAFSRDFEREADYYGFQYMYMAGFDLLKGAQVWERFAIEVPRSMTADLFATHPSSPERYLRAEKTLQELIANGLQPNLYHRPNQPPVSYGGSSPFAAAASIPGRVLNVPAGILNQAAGSAMSAASQAGAGRTFGSDPGEESEKEIQRRRERLESEIEALEKKRGTLAADDADLLRKRQELESRHAELTALKTRIQEEQAALRQLEEERQRQIEVLKQGVSEELIRQDEFERILLEAKEAAKQLRYAEFGIKEMGLAKNVTNLWIAKKVSGAQRIFPVSQGSLDWFIQYDYLSLNSWKALGMNHRKYRAYWYSPNGKLYSEYDFMQSQGRAEFAKTTLQWDQALGSYVEGTWLLRIFEEGKLLDERTFELVSVR